MNDVTKIKFPFSIVQVGGPVDAVADVIAQGFVPVPSKYSLGK